MKKGTISGIENQSSDQRSILEAKRRKILVLTPPPDIFLCNSGDSNEQNKELDVKLGLLGRNEESSSNPLATTLGLLGCETNGSFSREDRYDDKSQNRNSDRKHICDLDFFKFMSEDEEDNRGESGFSSSRYFEMVQHQDTNMNDVTKDFFLNATNHESENNMKVPSTSTPRSISAKELAMKTRSISLPRGHAHSQSSNLSSVTRNKVCLSSRISSF